MPNVFLRLAVAAFIAMAAGPGFAAPVFQASRAAGQPIVLSGEVPADATRRYFGIVAGDVPTAALTLSDALPADFIANAVAGLRALNALSIGQLQFDGSAWLLQGRADTPAARAAARASIVAVPAAEIWQLELGLVPALDRCTRQVTALGTRNAILFQSGSARITPASVPALDELAGYLDLCPAATIHVEGHTDADGEEGANLALSVARAEAVVAALITRGIGLERLYAVGYGESLPIAPNDTSAGKQANRRIAFTIEAGD